MRFVIFAILVLSIGNTASAQEITNKEVMDQLQSLQKMFSEHIAKEQNQQQQTQQQAQQQRTYTKAEIKQIRAAYQRACYPLKFDSIQVGADGKVIRVCK